MKKWLFVLFLAIFSAGIFSQARVSEEKYREFQQSSETFSPKDLKKAYSENAFAFEQKFSGKVFYIKGKVVSTRRSIFHEYIVRIEDDDDSWFPYSLNVVFPTDLSKPIVDTLAALKKGMSLRLLVVGRTTDEYVDALEFY